MKRLRKQFVPKNPIPKHLKAERDAWQFKHGIRYYQCGEYGEKNNRPHFHACLFNFRFPDMVFHKKSKNGDRLYRSKILTEIWDNGEENQQLIGELNFATAAYTARYIMKKINGPKAEEHYRYTDETTGEQYQIEPEYNTMSRRPGIASNWYKKYKTDVYPSDEVIIKGIPMQPPKYYDSILEKENPFLYDDIKHDRLTNAEKYQSDNTPERLHVKYKVKQAQANLLSRTLEEI